MCSSWRTDISRCRKARAPVLIDPDTLECRGARDFAGSWPARTTFTAHPKRDPVTGDVFAYGLTMALFPELVLARLPAGGKAFDAFRARCSSAASIRCTTSC